MILALGAPLTMGVALGGSWLLERSSSPPKMIPRAAGAAAEIRVLPGRLTLDSQLVWQGGDQHPEGDPLSRGLLQGLEAHYIKWRESSADQIAPAVHVCAHPRAKFGVLRRILTVSRRTGHDRIFLGSLKALTTVNAAVWRKDCSLVPILIPYAVQSARGDRLPDMRITLRLFIDEHFTLTFGGERLRIPSEGGKLNRLGLYKKLQDIRVSLPHKRYLEVFVADRVLHRHLMDALELALSAGFNELSLVDLAGSLLKPQPPLK